MKKLFLLVSAAATVLATQNSQATVTLQISQIGVARATGFANAAGTPTDGMRWGVVVSTADASFSSGSYDVFDFNTSGFLSVGGIPTDDYYVAHPTSAVTATLSATNGDPGGAGGITSINPVPFGGATNITANDAFSLIWFEAAPASGTSYGMFTDASFLIPGDTAVQSYASPFVPAARPTLRSAANLSSVVPLSQSLPA
ncbi:MAG: hypothetical protein H7A55_07300 [Verrucomicrobiaceae bacterium]|nr:hypothetical protein [Verrucomicrobiaceae bacterium]